MKNSKKILLLMMCLLCVCMLTACTVKHRRQRNSVSATGSPVNTKTLTGVVTGQDVEKQNITVRELDSNLESVLYYDSTAAVTNKFGETITAEQITTGEILELAYRTSDTLLVSAAVPEDVWEYDEVDSFSFRAEENMMRFADKKYQYSANTYISSSGQQIALAELNQEDTLTVRGVGIHVYSITRTAGHGYVRLTGYEDFTGGMVEVGNRIILPIADNMLITAPAGIYRVTLCKGVSIASKTATVQQDQTVTVDFSDYVSTAKDIGTVTFDIEPEGADLTINGTTVDYSQPVALNYGEYKITVAMTGYETYSGTLDVEDASVPVHIDLIEEQATVNNSATATPAASAAGDNNSPSGSTTSDSSSSSSTDSSAASKKVDSSQTITVTAPRGVEVYLDNVYKGLAPCKFKKVIGSQTVTLSQTGYVTKSYSIDILDDDEDVTLKFADLVKETSSR